MNRLDKGVLLPALGLVGVGLLFVWSTTRHGTPLMPRQLLFLAAAVLAAAAVLRLGTARLSDLAWPIYGLLLAVLAAMPLLAQQDASGTERWIALGGGFKLQPSEFMKLGLVLALARYLQHRGLVNTWSGYLAPFLITAVPWFFVVRQPDLGSSLVLLPVFVAMVYVSGARASHMVAVALLAAVLLPVAYVVPGMLRPYQKERLDSFLEPIPALLVEARDLRQAREHEAARDLEARIGQLKRGTGYQQFYSVVAIGSGGLLGQGLGNGLQNNGNRVPVKHSDFVFAIVGEEWGLLGAGVVVLLQAGLVLGVLAVAWRTREPFGRLVCVGVGAMLGGQVLMNLAIAVGLLPVTGVPLPLLSYGGSSLLATALALGSVLDVARRRTPVFFES